MTTTIFNQEQLENFRKNNNLDPYRVRQIFLEIFKNSILDTNQITTLPKETRNNLSQEFHISSLQIHKIVEDDEVVKFMLKTHDGKLIESVLMYHYSKHKKNAGSHHSAGREFRGRSINRMSLCISTQIGCPVGCIFCVTGKMGLTRNIKMDEMLSQILIVNNYIREKRGKKEDGTWRKVRNIVYMGMGEPFLNYNEVITTLPYLTNPKHLGLSNRRITISTSGITPAIRQFTKDNPECSLAFSLHAPTQELRELLVPFAKQFPLDEIMIELDKYCKKTGKEVFYEYVLIKEKNDSDDIAHLTGKLLKDRKAHLNLIPYNQNPAIELNEPSMTRCRIFQDIVESYGVIVTIRGNMGRKSKGACGQLGREEVQKKKKTD